MDRLKGKRAFMTASGAGIGRATALLFAAEGAEVIATDLHPNLIADLKGHGVAATEKLDVRDTPSFEALAKKYGPIDILYNGAGHVHHGTALDVSDEEWDLTFDINAKAMHRAIRAFLPGMIAKGGGSIVNVSSGASSVRGIPNRYVYGASKAAVIGLTKALAADFIRKGIRANAICPGTVQSPSLDGRIAAQARETGKSEKEIRQAFIDRQPMGRLGTAEEIAWLAVYLASDESNYTTGQIFLADGGFAL